MDLSVIALALTLGANDATDAAAAASAVEIVERPTPQAQQTRPLWRKHMQSPALVIAGSVLAAGTTAAIVGVSAAAASGDEVWQPLAPFIILATAGVLTGAISMIIVGAWQVPY